MQASANHPPVVPIGRMPMNNAFNGHPRRRAPRGGAKLNAKDNERKKPTLKEFLGVTPLDVLGNVTADALPSPVSLLEKFIGTSNGDATEDRCKSVESETDNAEQRPEGNSWQLQDGSRMNFSSNAQIPLPLDARTNLEKYMCMKMRESRGYMQFPGIGSPAPNYLPLDACHSYIGPQPLFRGTPTNEGMQGCWYSHGAAQQYTAQYNYESSAYQPGACMDAYVPATPTAESQGSPQQNNLPESLQFQSPPAWFHHKSYMPQVPQYSHMTAPVPGAPFHPGFSYATDFKYYYNYYSADQYAGEIDGGDATAQEEAVFREQQHAEAIVGKQESEGHQSGSTLKPIITSKRRLESGRAVPI